MRHLVGLSIALALASGTLGTARQLVAQAEYDTAQSNALAARAGVQASQGSVEQSKASLH